MADYRPETKVYLCEQVPLDDTYSDTINFPNIDGQTIYFQAMAKHQYTNLSYQRVNNSIANPRAPLTCRVPDLADNLYNCNYMMFQNNNFGDKWFYAFIKQVNYISPECTEIVYELDHLQTWLFDFEVKSAFVEREHSATDNAFDNILSEPIDITEFTQVQKYETSLGEGRRNIIYTLIATKSPTGDKPNLVDIGGILSGLYTASAFDADTISQIYAQYNDPADVIAIYASRTMTNENSGNTYPSTATINTGLATTIIPNYEPKNNKIYNSQFNFFKCVTGSGSELNLLPEKINVGELKFEWHQAGSIPPSSTFVPYYESPTGVTPTNENWNFALVEDQVIMCSWSQDTFNSWWAQNGGSATIGTISSVAKLIFGIAGLAAAPATGGASLTATAAAVSGGIGVLKNGASIYDATNAPDTPSNGIGSTGTSFFANNRPALTVYEMRADIESLKRADDFMTRFGYTTNKTKSPNRKSRTRFNYVKVSNPLIVGSMPVEAMATVKNVLTKGITFWHDRNNIGDYETKNETTGNEGW